MFKKSKLEIWWDSLPDHTKTYLKNQPIWHDSDMFKIFTFGFLVGLVIGLIC